MNQKKLKLREKPRRFPRPQWKIRIEETLLHEAESHYQRPTLQETQTKYQTNINVEEYPAVVATAADWNLSICMKFGGMSSNFPFLTWP